MSDFALVVRKEMLELINMARKERIRMLMGLVPFVAMVIILPLQIGYRFSVPLIAGMSAMSLVISVMFSAVIGYVGERERHTLETLLSTRLSDRSIYWGKLVTPVLVGFGTGLGIGLFGIAALTIMFGRWDNLPFAMVILAGALLVALVPAFLFAALGVFVSTRSSSLKQAMQAMSLVMFGFFMLPSVLFTFLSDALVEFFQRYRLTPLGLALVLGSIPVIVLALCALLVWLGFRRARRERLMLV